MYRSAAKTNSIFFRRLNAHFPGLRRGKVSSCVSSSLNSTGQSSQKCFMAWNTSGVIDTGQYTKQCTVYPPSVHYFQASITLVLQKRYNTFVLKPLARIDNRNNDDVNIRVPPRMVRLLSGKSDEENIDKKKASSSDLGKDKDGKGLGCDSEKAGQQPCEASAISETGRGGNGHEQDPVLKDSERHQPSPDTSPDLGKKKGDHKFHPAKKHNKRKLGRRLLPVETDPAKNIGDDRLQHLKEKLKRKLGKRWLSWEEINDTLDNFPYYVSENTRDLLVDSAAARLKEHKYSKFGDSLPSSSHLILLQGQPGTEIYQEVLVRALARHLRVSLLVLDSNYLAAKDLKDDAHISGLVPDEDDDDNKSTAIENWQSHGSGNVEDESSKSMDDLVVDRPWKISDAKECTQIEEKFGKPWKGPHELVDEEIKKHVWKSLDMENKHLADECKKLVLTRREDELKKLGKQGEELKKFWHGLIIGDRVKFVGTKDSKGKKSLKVRIGQEGFVTSISEGLPWKVCVKFGANERNFEGDEVFCDAGDLEKVEGSTSEDTWLARFPELPIEVLCEMVSSSNPVIVHFPDIQPWFARVAPAKGRSLFVSKVGDLLSKVNGPVVFIAGRIKDDAGAAAVKIGLDLILPVFMNPFETNKSHSREVDEETLKGTEKVFKIFKNIIMISPPEELQLLRSWQKQLDADKKTTLLRKNQRLLDKVLAYHGMGCAQLSEVNTLDLQLTNKNTEKVIGWARNMCLREHQIQVKDGKLWLHKECLERALVRLMALKVPADDKLKDIMDLAENEYERSLVSSVILAQDIGVKFDEIGALDDVKNTLKDLIILPLQRPELFSKGNLRKPCKGVLLFGPPGTGKTLLAKAVATEAGANFISISASTITSKYYGDDEKLVKAVFALARKLTPAIIFIDEVDSILGARGHASEYEASRRIKNEFMACWDGLHSKENEQILVLATTNRPFDLDDAVVRRLPRRLLVDLPNIANRVKILRIILAKEDLTESFDFRELAAQTEGYSGSDLKNLCVAAAYKPIREFLAAEKQGKVECLAGSAADHNCLHIAVRALCLEDFIQAKSTIGTSIAYDAASMIQLRRWNEQYGEGGSRTRTVFGFSK